mmetsp:Transcript_15023/g.25715  ORF Transcript_15023/g.25715 Transcript_15023/m.25715 type:complete len:227 (+) Transcript_15023:362-1042(+)
MQRIMSMVLSYGSPQCPDFPTLQELLRTCAKPEQCCCAHLPQRRKTSLATLTTARWSALYALRTQEQKWASICDKILESVLNSVQCLWFGSQAVGLCDRRRGTWGWSWRAMCGSCHGECSHSPLCPPFALRPEQAVSRATPQTCASATSKIRVWTSNSRTTSRCCWPAFNAPGSRGTLRLRGMMTTSPGWRPTSRDCSLCIDANLQLFLLSSGKVASCLVRSWNTF